MSEHVLEFGEFTARRRVIGSRWVFSRREGNTRYEKYDGPVRADFVCCGHRELVQVPDTLDDDALEPDALARLFAAAPDLLESAKAALRATSLDVAKRELKRAIAKAEGR